jgi:hypothetical protein
MPEVYESHFQESSLLFPETSLRTGYRGRTEQIS